MAVLTERSATHGRFGRRVSTRASFVLLGVLLGALLALAGAVVVTQLTFDGRALPGLRVAGTSVGTLETAGIRERLQTEIARPWAAATVRISDGTRTWDATNAELGIAPDIDAAVASAIAYGKTGSPLDRMQAWVAAFGGHAGMPFSMRAEGSSADRFVARIASELDTPVVDGEIALGPLGATIREPNVGRELDRGHFMAALLGAQALGDRNVELRVRTRYPSVDAAGIADAAALVRTVTAPLEVSAGEYGVSEDPAGLASFLVVERVVAAPGELPAIAAEVIAPQTRYRYTVKVAEDRVRAWSEAVANELDRPARNASYTVRRDGSLAVVPSITGLRIDRDAFTAQALREIATTGRRLIAPALVTEAPVFTTEQAQRYTTGMSRLSSFETFFPPNAARWRNIATGAARFNNVVISPGETFSFWRVIGPVTVATGYTYSGAIIDGVSNPNIIGGGLCQVSTTLFMAVAQAGFQIVERGQHDYYIDRYPLGLDAAVFDPGLDLRWRNDTPYPVLIRSSSSNIAVEFEIFSIPNGRTTTFGAPVETNVRDVRSDQPADPAFPPGAKVLGRDITRSRTVSENGRVVHYDVFRSRYNPVWGGPAR